MGAFSRIMKLEGAKRIWIWHDHGIKGLTYKWLPFFLNRLDMTIANSDYELIKLSGNGIANSKIVRIHNGIDCTRWVLPFDKRMQFKKEVREKYGIPLSSKVWGYVGRLSSEKGCDVFVTSAAEILEKYSNAYFLIVGDGGMRNELECEVRASHLEKKIIFAGFQTEMEKYISCLDVLILPSKMETFSLTILQAMALGIPVVATDVGGNPEQVVNGYTGYMCKTENPIDLAMKVCQLFANADNCNVMGKRAREIITNYLNTNRMMYQIETVYNDLLKRHTV
jgi:glycosyltransferase involved in cell wall biosynthesis